MKNILTLSLVIIVTAFITKYITQQEDNPSQQSKEDSTFERVTSTNTIRCGYTLYSVGLNKDKEGNLYGIYKDIMDELGKLLSLNIQWTEEVGWGEQIEGLKTKRYDMVCSPANLTGPRVRHADFSPALYYSPVYAWARKDDKRFWINSKDMMNRINQSDIKVATIDGEQAEAQAKKFFPKAQLYSAPQSSSFATMFTNVTTRKADITIAEPASVRAFLENMESKDLLIPLNEDNPLILAVNIMMIKQGDMQFKALIHNAIETLEANGALHRIIEKWEPYPNSYIRTKRIK